MDRLSEDTAEFIPGGSNSSDVHGSGPDGEVGFRDIAALLYREKWLVLATTLLIAGIALIIAFTLPSVYRAEITLAAAQSETSSGLGQLASRLSDISGIGASLLPDAGTAKTQRSIARLRSRAFTIGFVKDHNLFQTLFADRWESAEGRWSTERGLLARLLGKDPPLPPTDLAAYSKFDRLRTIRLDENTGILTLSVEWEDPIVAAKWANQLIARLNAESRERVVERSRKNLEYLNTEVADTQSLDLRNMLFRLIEVETQNIMFAQAQDEFAFAIIDPAMPPEKPAGPNRPLILIMGLLFGMALGLVLAVLKNFVLASRSMGRHHMGMRANLG